MQTKLPPELQQSTFAGFVPNKRPKASLNDGWGCIMLGSLYADGRGVKQNKKVSKEYYVKQNKKVAREYFGKACGLGVHEGCWKNNDLLIQQEIKGEDD